MVARGDSQQAERFYRGALTIIERALGSDSPEARALEESSRTLSSKA